MGTSRGYVFDDCGHSPISMNLSIKANILVDQTFHARLADFGLLTIISDPGNLFCSSSYIQGGTARWMSPELIAPQRFGLEKSRPTRSSDCYALGMAIYETISGNLPFRKHTDLTVFTKVLEGDRPPRGARFTESLWKMLELCWASQLKNRPSIEDVLQCLMISDFPGQPFGVDSKMEDAHDLDSEMEDVHDLDSESGSSDATNIMTHVHQHKLPQINNQAQTNELSSVTSPL